MVRLMALLSRLMMFASNPLSSAFTRKNTLLILVLLSSALVLISLLRHHSPFINNLTLDTPRITTSLVTGVSQSPKLPNSTSERKQRFPQAIIIGVRKSGTRALINMLNLHPDIVSAREEVHYFDRDENFNKGIQWYIDRMPLTTQQQITIEKTPNYFVREAVPRRISMVSPNIKLLVIVRNPIDRALSDFTQLDWKRKKSGGEAPTFEELAFQGSEVNKLYPPVSFSMYDVHFKEWLKYFKLSQILVVDGDSFIKYPVRELKRAESFIGVDSFFKDEMFYFNQTKGFYCWKRKTKHLLEVPNCLGSGKGREHPTIPEKSFNSLKRFFQPHNEEFFSLTQMKFDW